MLAVASLQWSLSPLNIFEPRLHSEIQVNLIQVKLIVLIFIMIFVRMSRSVSDDPPKIVIERSVLLRIFCEILVLDSSNDKNQYEYVQTAAHWGAGKFSALKKGN